MAIFAFKDYREFLKYKAGTHNDTGRGGLSKMAKAVQIERSLLSQILKGVKNLSLEQGYLLANYLGLSEVEKRYFELLLQYDRAQSHTYKHDLLMRMKTLIDSKKSELMNDQTKTQFYSSWIYGAVQLATGVPGLQTPENIAKRLGLDLKIVLHALKMLVDCGLCKTNGEEFTPGIQRTHLEEGSPQSGRHKSNWRFKAVEKMQKSKPDDYFYTGAVRIDRKAYIKISKMLKDVQLELEQAIKTSGDDTLACINLDWFEM